MQAEPLADPQTEWARLLLGAFADAGVRDVVSSPGSRSTPFVLAAAAEPRLRLTSIIDERAAAFFALGQARVSGRPSLLLCTSGSAPAHYLPAVVEARHARTPLLVLSADRPLEVQGAGGHQTIDQTRLFGELVERFIELGSVDASEGALRGHRRLVAEAVAAATDGAVHVNARARKPLEPSAPKDAVERADSERIRVAAATPLLRIERGASSPVLSGLPRLARRIAEEPAGVIVVGPAPLADRQLALPLRALAAATGYPILAEVTSQLTCSDEILVGVLGSVLATPRSRAALRPRLVIQVGPTPVAAAYERLLADGPHLEVIARSSEANGDGRAAALHIGDPTTTLALLGAALATTSLGARDPRWMKRWRDAAAATASALAPKAAAQTELGAVRALLASIGGAQLMVGNSLPVRELDLAAGLIGGPTSPRAILHQRGASGIDGLVAGASGAASIGGATVLLLGDVSLLHDLHGLLVAGQRVEPLLVAVLCNGGGRIFETLPIGARDDLRAALPLLTTPIAPDLGALARFCGARHARATDAGAIAALVSAALEHRGATLLELVVDPRSAADLEAALGPLVDDALAAAGLLHAEPAR